MVMHGGWKIRFVMYNLQAVINNVTTAWSQAVLILKGESKSRNG